MLTRFHKILIGLLVVQLALAAILLTRHDDNVRQKEHPLFASFDAAKVTRVQVAAGGGEAKPGDKPIDLIKQGTSWALASAFNYPADGGKIGDALAPIAKLNVGAPIATQASRHKQLHVADDDFLRKLTMMVDGKDVTLYVGGSAGVRRTAVRIGGSDDVYGVSGLTAPSLSSEPRQWVDPAYLKIAAADVAKLTIVRDGKTYELTKVTDAPAAGAGSAEGGEDGSAAPPASHWDATVDGAPIKLAAGESLDQSMMDRLVNEASDVELASPADAKRDASKPTATVTVQRKPPAAATDKPTPPVVYDVIADGAQDWVHDRSSERAVLADKSRLDDVVAVGLDKLVKKPPPAKGAGAGSAAADGLPEGLQLPPGALPPGMQLPPGVQLPPPGAQ